MFDTVQVVFDGSSKKYTYLTDVPVGIGDIVEVNTPSNGPTHVSVVGVGGTEYTGSMKTISRVIWRAACLSSMPQYDMTQPNPDFKREVFVVMNIRGEPARGRRWHDTQDAAETHAEQLIADNERNNHNRGAKYIVMRSVAVVATKDPAITVTRFKTKKQRKK